MEQNNELILGIEDPAMGESSVWTNRNAFNQMLRAADMLSKTALVPATYQGRPQDCFVAIEFASRIGLSPLTVMQNLYVVKGRPSWSGQACMMLINAGGKFANAKHVYTGNRGTEERGCYVTATRISDGERVDGTEVTLAMAKAEGWTLNKKWQTMPDLMLAYRAAAFFARVHCPEVLAGCYTAEENIDIALS